MSGSEGGLEEVELEAILSGPPTATSPAPQRFGAAVGEEARGYELEPRRAVKGGGVALYQYWPSRNLFCCGGLLMTGGSNECWFPSLCVWTMILGPSTLYFVWVFPSLIQHGALALPGATLVIFMVTAGLLCMTCCTDPGIIPRREVILATGTAAKLQEALGYDVLGVDGGTRVPPVLHGQGYRWCHTCRIVRPPRASHCSDCDNCVMRYDHHCPFVNNCVGQRNYAYFIGFLISVLVLVVLVIPAIFGYFSSINRERSVKGMASISNGIRLLWYLLIAGGGIVLLAALLSCLLASYHFFLVVTNQTTKEFRRSIPNIAEEPTLCAPRGPRLFDPWARVDARDLYVQREERPGRSL